MLFTKIVAFALPILGAFAAPTPAEQGLSKRADVQKITAIINNLQVSVVSTA